MKSSEVRRQFLDYFVRQQHTLVPSSSLIPRNDPTLLFTNAGMVPFKNVFLGSETRPYARACSAQKCMRVSGKHNDLEEVGISPRHHTFFEMLGNFSFGDYFKRDAIRHAWELLTQEFRLPIERLWITVYQDDDETACYWEEAGVDTQRILRFGEKENFWSMGDTGPCGYNSEIHYYRGTDLDRQHAGGVNSDDDDYIEVWNLVFMQYNRDAQGRLTPLPKLAVDTGMGFERLVAALQGVRSNYETDLFQPVLERLIEIAGADRDHYQEHSTEYHIIADHSRAIAFLLADGVLPGNTGHSYVLRRVIRRASYYGQVIGITVPFLADVAQVVIDTMGEAYPELCQRANVIREWTTTEERRFSRTLKVGLRYLDIFVQDDEIQRTKTLSGYHAFKLHDTYGFPLDLTQKILAERRLEVNVAEYEELRREQQERSRQDRMRRVEMT